MTIMDYVAETLQEWKAEYAEYNGAMSLYNQTSRIGRWLKNMKEPKHPRFHSIPLVKGAYFTIELRCYDGLFLACSDGDHKGYKLDLQKGERTPLLGARGMDVNPRLEELVKEYAEIIHNIAF